ncbi:Large exoprotein s involved in heme utilization or adhesion [Pseudomonas syringae pv. avellanae str. ISPaVe013]|nr:Large exoprotein s involved in heme utilization or adhesion [Pseudomonas syringae pv. avellanae str. ISPaVe013]
MASGKKVIADVGGDLNIESLQDTNTYKVDEKSLGFGVSLCIPPFCTGMSTISGASGNFGATNIDSNYASVTEQSGIKAGDDGFDINVRGNTDLVGAVIASSDKAVQDGKNSLVTSSHRLAGWQHRDGRRWRSERQRGAGQGRHQGWRCAA